MIRGMGIKIQDAFRLKKPAKEQKSREVESLVSNVRITYLSRKQLEEAALAEKYLLENLDHGGSDFKNLYFLKHQFLIVELDQPCFCDLCGLLIWGVYRLSLKCRNCNLSCHPQCKQFLRLICPKPRPEKSLISADGGLDNYDEPETHDASSSQLPADADELSGPSAPVPLAIKDFRLHSREIAEFNNSFPFALLQLETNRSYSAFVKILLRLKRPITVANGPYPKARVTSFYLPRNSEKLIHINSAELTPDVIEAILSKFRIRDDPRKFSLHIEDGDGVRRLDKSAHPLQVVIEAGKHSRDCCRIILQETDPKTVLWDAFTEPELENFKSILDKEEEDFIRLTVQNYEMYKTRLMQALDLHRDKLED